MMSHRPNSPSTHNRPRSSSHPVRPQQVRRLSEANESVPVRPPRNPARRLTLGEERLAPPPVAFKPTTASEDNHRERKIYDRDSPSVNVPPPKYPVNRKQPTQTTPPPQINTLDRKILLELKRSMLARSAQFALKNNIKHHPFPPDEAPYPRSYDHKCIDTDVWENVFCEQFCGNVTFHTFDVPPTKVLDLGCGSGSWVMACARRWKNCHFVGLDIVPLHPDLGKSELSKRVSWVQANFLEPLPFPNEEFDFVHIKRIARGVPEDKWDALFEEIVRVMKPGAVLEMLEEDLYIPGQMMETVNNDSPSPAASSSGSLEELSQLNVSSLPGPSTSLPDISTEQSYRSSQAIRRSTSERTKKLSSASRTSSNTRPPPLPTRSTPPSPQNVRPFPLLKPSNPTARPIASHFNLHNLLQKRPSRDGRAGTAGEQPRKTKKESPIPVSLSTDLYPLSIPGSSTTPNQKHPAKKMHRPVSSGGRLPSPKPYLGTTRSSSNLMVGSNTNVNVVVMPTQTLHEFGEGDPPLTLPPVRDTNGRLEVNFPQVGQNGDPGRARTRSFSYPTPGDDGQQRSSASREFGPFDLNTVSMHGHAQQVRPSNVQNSQNRSVLTDVEPIESNRRDTKLIIIPPVPPPKDIPGRSKPQSIPSSSSSSNVSNPTTGLSRSVPDRFTDQLLSPTLESSKPMKSLSTSSLAISTNRSTGQVPSLLQNSHSSDNSGAGNSPTIEIPPNPRQHKLLEIIYTEMHTARFVNLAPLSLLENYIRTYFENVRTHAPLIFTFPPPPGCEHRPEFDAAESQQGKLNRTQQAEDDDDQDHYLRPDTPPSARSLLFPLPPATPPLGSPKSISSRFSRERSLSVTSNEPGPSRARISGTKLGRRSITGPETTNHRRPRSSKSLAGHGDGTVPDRVIMTGTSEYVMSMTGGFSPARVAKADKSTSSASDEREDSRQRSNSLFTRLNDAKGNGEGGEARTRLLAPALKLTRPPTTSSLPPAPPFEYKTYNATSSISLSPSIISSSSSTIIQSDSGKRKLGLTAADKAHLSALLLSNKKAEIDVRSLNLHLRVRVVEILGCSEAMWDWVKEFQYRELEKERKRKERLALAASTVQGVGGGRVSYYHRDRVKNNAGRERQNSVGNDNPLHRKKSTKSFSTSASKKRHGDDGYGLNGDYQGTLVKVPGNVAVSPTSSFSTSLGSAKGDDPSEHLEKSVKQELLRMTRERFDEILSWFQFDMDDSIRLTRSMAIRTPSSSFTTFTTDPTEHRRSFDEACQKLKSYLQQHPQRSASLVKPNDTANGCEATSKSSQHSQQYEELCCLPPLLNLVHPSKRLCRTIRVWVAWKP